jgi:hypothetical protein
MCQHQASCISIFYASSGIRTELKEVKTYISWFQRVQCLAVENYITICCWPTLFSLPSKHKWKMIMDGVSIKLWSAHIQMEVAPTLQKARISQYQYSI